MENKNEFRMPGEWENHSATWLAWPNDDDYFEDIKNVEKIYLEIVKNLYKDEFVKLLVLNDVEENRVKDLMVEAGIDLLKIIFYHARYFDVWMRDYGPMFIKNEKDLAWVKWNYDGYGGKFPELLPDNKVFFDLQNSINSKMISTDIALEGGAIDSNGSGTILTTEECLLENRNKGKSKEENNLFLENLIGATNVCLLYTSDAADE